MVKIKEAKEAWVPIIFPLYKLFVTLSIFNWLLAINFLEIWNSVLSNKFACLALNSIFIYPMNNISGWWMDGPAPDPLWFAGDVSMQSHPIIWPSVSPGVAGRQAGSLVDFKAACLCWKNLFQQLNTHLLICLHLLLLHIFRSDLPTSHSINLSPLTKKKVMLNYIFILRILKCCWE